MFGFLKRLFRGRHVVDSSEVRDESGMRVAASAGPPKPKIPKSTDEIEVRILDAKEVVSKCGHSGPSRFSMNAYGLDLPFDAEKQCVTCTVEEAKKVVIRCVLCGLPILPGESVATYGEDSGNLRKDIGYKVGTGYLGCMRSGCCPSGGFYAGVWDGVKFRAMFAEGSLVAHVMATGKPTIVNL